MEIQENPLGYQSINKLLLKLAIPAIIANVFNALYNIVDQVFIGRGVGRLANAATNIAFPIVIICMALGFMAGIGSASNYSLELGRQNSDKAKKIVGTNVTTLVIVGLVLIVVIRSNLHSLVMFFGSTEDIYPYAIEYTKVTSLGIPFLLFCLGMNPIVRADGSPKYSMFAIVAGAVLNTILDPIFIFVFDMGIGGAAWATVISQIVSAFILFCYLFRFKRVDLKLQDFTPRFKWIRAIVALGFSSFILQSSNMIVQIVVNNMLRKYGALSVYGSETPLAVYGIVMKISIIFSALVIGIVQGSQPIVGYNYGAKKYARVRQTTGLVIKSTLCISFICLFVFEVFPAQIIGIFGNGDDDPLYFVFAVRFMRIFMMFLYFIAIQMAIITFFPSIGKAFKSAFLSLTKQIIILIPLLNILPLFFGLNGIIIANPISDVVSALIAIIMIYFEFKIMPKEDIGLNKVEA